MYRYLYGTHLVEARCQRSAGAACHAPGPLCLRGLGAERMERAMVGSHDVLWDWEARHGQLQSLQEAEVMADGAQTQKKRTNDTHVRQHQESSLTQLLESCFAEPVSREGAHVEEVAGQADDDSGTTAEDDSKQAAQMMHQTVQEALVCVLWEAIHARRSLFGTICHDVPSFFAAADQSSNGRLSHSELHEAFTRLDIGLTVKQLDRLLGTMDTDRDGKVSLPEFDHWISIQSGARMMEPPAGPWTPVAAITGKPVRAERADHLPVAQISTDSSGWKEVLGGTAVARGRARGNAALGRASRNGTVPIDGQSSPWRQQMAVAGSDKRPEYKAGTPPRVPQSPSVTSSPDSLFAATASERNSRSSSRNAATQAPLPEAWGSRRLAGDALYDSTVGSGWRASSKRQEESEEKYDLSETDLDEAAQSCEAGDGCAAATSAADLPASEQDGWELCYTVDGVKYWYNFQTSERRELLTGNNTAATDPADEPVEEPRRYDTHLHSLQSDKCAQECWFKHVDCSLAFCIYGQLVVALSRLART